MKEILIYGAGDAGMVAAINLARTSAYIDIDVSPVMHLTPMAFYLNDTRLVFNNVFYTVLRGNREGSQPYAHGYALGETGGWEDVSVLYPPSMTGAAGAMISDLEDMKKWVKAYVTGTTNSDATQREQLSVVDTGKPGLEFQVGSPDGAYGL